jgi:ParB-like chromosome segregation protein Spo0J
MKPTRDQYLKAIARDYPGAIATAANRGLNVEAVDNVQASEIVIAARALGLTVTLGAPVLRELEIFGFARRKVAAVVGAPAEQAARVADALIGLAQALARAAEETKRDARQVREGYLLPDFAAAYAISRVITLSGGSQREELEQLEAEIVARKPKPTPAPAFPPSAVRAFNNRHED